MAQKTFAPQDDPVLASWDAPCPGQVENVGGENAPWRFKVETGGQVFEVMQAIAKTFGFLLYFDNLGKLHYEPDLFPLIAAGYIPQAVATSLLKYLAKGEFLSLDHFTYDNAITGMEATTILLGRHDGVMVAGEAAFPTCCCGRVRCAMIGRNDASGRYHYIQYGGSQPWNANRKIVQFRYVDNNSGQQRANPMLSRTWLYAASPNLTNPTAVNRHADYLAIWCKQWWVGETYEVRLTGQPHLWPGDFITIKNLSEQLFYFYLRAVHSQASESRFETSAAGVLIPNTIVSPPNDASELGWSGLRVG